MTPRVFGLALLATLAVVGCDKNVTGGNANAPGSPGTGNAREVTAPAAADSPVGDATGGMKGSGSAGASGRDVVPGVTGKGTSEAGGRSQSPQAGAGTAGGLGGSSGLGMTGSFPVGGASGAAASGPGVNPPGSTSR